MGRDARADGGVVTGARWLGAILVSSLVLTAVQVTELVVVVGPAAVALLAQPLAMALVAGLVMVAFSHVPRFGTRQHRRDPWRRGEPSWPAWCANWSVGRIPDLVAVHGRDGPGLRAPRL